MTDFKGKKTYVCGSPMLMWLSLEKTKYKNGFTREDYKSLIKRFPYKTQQCKCKDCRYFRFVKRLQSK